MRNRECQVDSSACLTRAMMVIGYVSILLMFCGSIGEASLSKESGSRVCNRGSDFQSDDQSTENLDQLQNSQNIAPVYRTDGEPVLLKRILQGTRIRKSGDESQYDDSIITGYDSNDGDVLKSLIMNLLKNPRRLNRSETKSEKYNLRANYIPRLGRKRSFPVS